jgi:hypothetical protein
LNKPGALDDDGQGWPSVAGAMDGTGATRLQVRGKRQEQVLRNRTWATAGKMTFKQLALLFGVSKALAGDIEKTVLSKLQNHYIAELVDVNYHLLVEFAARCNRIEFTDTCFDFVNLSEQEKIITGSLLGLAILHNQRERFPVNLSPRKCLEDNGVTRILSVCGTLSTI